MQLGVCAGLCAVSAVALGASVLDVALDASQLRWIYGSTIGMVGVYALAFVPFPSFFHWFVASFAGLFLMFPLVATFFDLLVLPGKETIATYTVLATGGIALFALSYLAGGLVFPRAPVGLMHEVTLRRLGLVIWGLAAAHASACLLFVLDVGLPTPGTFLRLFGETREQRKLAMGPLSLVGTYIVLSGGALYALAPLYVKHRPILGVLLVTALIGIEVFLFLAMRARTPLILHLSAVLVGVVALPSFLRVARGPVARRPQAHERTRTLILATATAVVALMASTQLRAIRGYIGGGRATTPVAFDPVGALQMAVVDGELGYSPTVFSLIEMVPRNYDFLWGQSYYRLGFVGIPRSIWPEKPPNTGQVVGRWFVPTSAVHSQNPGVIGDLYINFGLWGTVGMAVFGLIFSALDSRRTLRYVLIVASSFPLLFHFARGSFTNVVLQLAVIALVVGLTLRLMQMSSPLETGGRLMPVLGAPEG